MTNFASATPQKAPNFCNFDANLLLTKRNTHINTLQINKLNIKEHFHARKNNHS